MQIQWKYDSQVVWSKKKELKPVGFNPFKLSMI